MADLITVSEDSFIKSVGMYRVKGQECVSTVIEAALEAGYRSIDTATGYRNEDLVAKSLSLFLPRNGLKREDIFITSKLAPKDQGQEKSVKAVYLSLQKLSTVYLDLYLIHWPGTQGLSPEDSRNLEFRRQSWKALEELYEEKKLRSIGVSNYTIKHLTEMLTYAKTMPHVLQVEYHPHYIQEDLRSFCKEHGIHLQAYSSLGTTVCNSPLLSDPVVLEISEKYNKTPAQILLKWAIQQEIGVLPKSQNPDHIKENMMLDFIMEDKDMKSLSSLGIRTKYAWDPSQVA
ncbi:9,11-endoperoxide prostaglandin H2 reductase-like isoform X2 [Artemia franciscana]|uniref:9,11-endoperoxide prostaglandin H2 reductase-like isoform X2 n=1 Tax=Artemia franciscana TaxID=6661 RepID=UPI0032DB1A6A